MSDKNHPNKNTRRNFTVILLQSIKIWTFYCSKTISIEKVWAVFFIIIILFRTKKVRKTWAKYTKEGKKGKLRNRQSVKEISWDFTFNKTWQTWYISSSQTLNLHRYMFVGQISEFFPFFFAVVSCCTILYIHSSNTGKILDFFYIVDIFAHTQHS